MTISTVAESVFQSGALHDAALHDAGLGRARGGSGARAQRPPRKLNPPGPGTHGGKLSVLIASEHEERGHHTLATGRKSSALPGLRSLPQHQSASPPPSWGVASLPGRPRRGVLSAYAMYSPLSSEQLNGPSK